MSVTDYIYFVRNEDNGLVKIGFSADPTRRLRQLKSEVKSPLTLLMCIPGGREVERDFHEILATSRRHGEWFGPSRMLHQLLAIGEIAMAVAERRAKNPEGTAYWHEWAGLL